MDLHRSPDKAEWLLTPVNEWNMWQRIAFRTKGLVTPANVVTIVGFGLVASGVVAIFADEYWAAVWLIGVGRFCDLLDGWLATRTKTKSPMGEMLDAGVDKLETAAVLIALLATQVLPWVAGLVVFVPQCAIALLIIRNAYYRVAIHPSLVGKWGMAAAWLGFGSYLIHEAVGSDTSDIWILLAHVFIAVSSILGGVTLAGYIRDYAVPKKTR